MEMTYRFKNVKGSIVSTKVPRYVPTGKNPDYTNKKAYKTIKAELGSMRHEISSSEKSSSVLVMDDLAKNVHRAYTPSTFPSYMRNAGISSRKDFLQVLGQKKGVRYDRLKGIAIDRLNNGYKNDHGYALPDVGFKVDSKQLHDNKNIIFRRVHGRLVPMRIPKDKRVDLMQEAPF